MNRPGCRPPPHQLQQSQAWSPFDIHGQPPPPSPQLPYSLNVNVHLHHHHHHNLPTPPPPQPSPYWHVPSTSPYHHQYYPIPYGHSLPPPTPFPVQYYPNYFYGNHYGGGGTGGVAATAASVQEAPTRGPGLVLSNQPARHPYTMPNWQPKSEEELRDSILYQVEFYFSVDNLIGDWYLRNKMDEQGWVSVDVIASFQMVKRKSRDINLILDSLKPSQVVEVQGNKMRRRDDWSTWIAKQ